MELEAYIQANEQRWAAVNPNTQPDTGRLKIRKAVHALIDQHFDMTELEQVAFEAGMEIDNLDYRTKHGLIREMILHSLHNNGVSRLVGVLKEYRDFVEWPDFE